MKIAIVSGASKNNDSVRGIGVHTQELFKALKLKSNKNLEIPELSRDDDLSSYDIVHFTTFRPFFRSLPFFKTRVTKFVLTIHDLIPLIYPNVYKPGVKGTINFLINKFLVWKNISAIITISETSKKDICRFLNVDPNKVFVIYLGTKKEYHPAKTKETLVIKNKYKLPSKFVFYFGDINFNKNIQTLVKACNILDIKLVIAGKQASEVQDMDLDHPENKHLKDIDFKNVIRLGYVSDYEANILLNLAVCLVQPSFYEGFGLSVVHAFASGCPVVASNTQALVEIGGDACLYFDPYSVDELVSSIKTILDRQEIKKTLVKKGFNRVKKFDWVVTSNKTLDVYERI